MTFYCQKDSFACELKTEVVSCKPVTKKMELGGKKVTVAGSEVVCADTVLFPEGGGQNTDHGTIDNVRVLGVTRVGSSAVAMLDTQVEWTPGTSVTMVVDWSRRWDNMQQHTGQHLVSAVLEKHYNAQTLSWWMAESSVSKVGVSYIELSRAISDQEMMAVQEQCNDVIRSAWPVTVHSYNIGDPALDAAHTRGLPADHAGQVRVVTIGGQDNVVDTNLCCGTHVSNTSQLQMIQLLGTETKKNKHFLNFLVGGRVSSYLQSCVLKERALTKILNNAPEEHVQLVEKMQKSLKVSLKSNSNMLKEIAVHQVKLFKETSPLPKYFFHHRPDGDIDFVNTVLKEIGDLDITTIIITGDCKDTSGQLVVTGNDPDKVQTIGKKLCELLEGKGGGKGQRFNAKIQSLKQIVPAENFIKSEFQNS